MIADISYETSVIGNNERGEEVRDAYVEAIKKLAPKNLVRIPIDRVNEICSWR